MEKIKFGILAGLYTSSGNVDVDRTCYGFSLINKGADTVKVNNVVLKGYPPGHPELSGESFSFVDPLGRYYTEPFVISFQTLTDPLLQIVQYFEKQNS